MSTNKALKQFRIMAIAEGFSWLGLLVTMYLKYGQALPEPNKWVGMIHGVQSISLSGEAGIFYGQVAVIVQNNAILKKLIENIKKIDGIDKVTRVYTN